MEKKRMLYLTIAVFVVAMLLFGCQYQPAENVPEVEDIDISLDEVDLGLEEAEIEEGIGEAEAEELPEEEGEMVVGEENGVTTVTVFEGTKVKLNLKGTDPDGDPITYAFSQPLDGNGEWQTKEGDAGRHEATIIASDGKSKTEQKIIIIVKIKNAAPVLEPISDITANEGETVELKPVATDPDGDPVTITYSGWMSSDKYKTAGKDIGTHTVTITASDGTYQTSQDVKVTVVNINMAPVIEGIADIKVNEGEKAVVKVVATDPDNDKVSISFDSYFNENGEWQTKAGDAGTYEIKVTASDGKNEATATFVVKVISVNNPPVLELISSINVKEGETVRFAPVATDKDGDEVAITYSGWMTSATYTTTYEDAGTHKVTVTASDGKDEASQEVTVTVGDVNRPPEFCVFC